MRMGVAHWGASLIGGLRNDRTKAMSEKEYVESQLPKYPGLRFRRFTVEEYYAIFELDCLPEGTSQNSGMGSLWKSIPI